MADSHVRNPKVLTELQALAERNIDQAKSSLDEMMNVTRCVVCALEDRTRAAQEVSRDLQGKAVDNAWDNVSALLEQTRRLLAANDADEMVRLQAGFVTARVEAVSEQARDMARRVVGASAGGAPDGRATA